MTLELKNILEKSYFPIELPPPFSTTNLGNIIDKNTIQIANTPPRFSPPAIHNLVRAGGLRRNLSLPNPKHFYKLSNYIVNHWTDIESSASRSKFSLTKPVINHQKRAIMPQYNLNERSNKITQLRASAKYILKTDISRFFPSIYSHCIPWALLGKENAKNLLSTNKLSKTWQDKFDVYSRGINNNQTIGIPIGPDTSRVIAEIILGEIDNQLLNRMRKLKGIRFIDDYEFALYSYNDAEKVLCNLQSLLNDYELALNPNKTKIIQLPDLIEPKWTSEIRTHVFRNSSYVTQMYDLISYFNIVFEYLKNNPDEGILKYAIALLKSEIISKDNWKMYENMLANCILNDPSCLPQVYEQLIYYSKEYGYYNNKLWFNVLNKIIYERVPLGQSSETAWAMWILKELSIGLSVKNEKIIATTDDSIVALMAIGLESFGLIKKEYLDNFKIYSSSSYLYEPQWLLCYQLSYINYFSSDASTKNLGNDPFFKLLFDKNISFFDINTKVSQPKRNENGKITSKIADSEY